MNLHEIMNFVKLNFPIFDSFQYNRKLRTLIDNRQKNNRIKNPFWVRGNPVGLK